MKICEILKKKDVGSIGIGAMIVFIAMVLVAGIAASVLIQTSTKLESQAMTTGQETLQEVATGLAVFNVEGHVDSGTNKIDKLFITVRPRAGSTDIDMNEVFIELANTSHKMILNYSQGMWNDSGTGVNDLYALTVWSSSAKEYGLVVVEDGDGSISRTNPTINKGDKVMIAVKADTVFLDSAGIAVRTDIWGVIVPELGSPGVISFTTPASYGQTTVHDLQ